MGSKYYAIPAEGQLDDMACWAACLKWWLKAVRSVNKTQRTIIDKYNYLTDDYGAMNESGIEWLIVDNDMYIEVFDRARDFTADVVRQRLSYGPLYVAYTETSSRKKHVNVIYGIQGSGNHAKVKVMEPQSQTNPDWTFTGAHKLKNLSDFNRLGSVYFGYN
ncbi:MAG: papain-like cysteine protease family protein [Pyrinomonadaceae bacterium]